ncbi:endonuclease/exonuclease/phosphatase family protein [Microbispora sp. H11081]|uniref:endonuclease/exonuclease/phosphatase family protein n=1 Tax=Microbispora sp. H11081 TaxID=2729107 RepID=UPI00147422E7|nr:endonuclease/exonuclease/phosphatase family protein [Microbispora sp. H11081]
MALVVGGLPPAADTYRVNVLTFNVCAAGNSAGTCVRDLTPRRRATWAGQVSGLIRSRDVDVASFTEMCYAQVGLLRRALPGYRVIWYGYAKGGGPGREDRCRTLWGDLTEDTTPPDGKTFGMALALKNGAEGPPPLRRLLHVDHPPAAPGATIHPRGLLCATGRVGPRRSVCCVTHISDTETPRQVTGLVARYAAGAPVILTGDFNREPGHDQLTGVYGMGLGDGGYVEAGAGSCGVPSRDGEPTTRGGRKIDYIFATEADYRPGGAEAVRTDPELSDHLALAGTLIGTEPRPRRDGGPWRGSCPACGRRSRDRRR